MKERHVQTVHALATCVRHGEPTYLLQPHDRWIDSAGRPMYTVAVKTLRAGHTPKDRVMTTLEQICQHDLRLSALPKLTRTLAPLSIRLQSPGRGELTNYSVQSVVLSLPTKMAKEQAKKVEGIWMTVAELLNDPRVSPTAKFAIRNIHAPQPILGPMPPVEMVTARLAWARDVDREAFVALWESLLPEFTARLAKKYRLVDDELDDALDNARLRALTYLEQFDSGMNGKGWLIQIVYNAGATVIRDRDRFGGLIGPTGEMIDVAAPEAEEESELFTMRLRLLRERLAQLEPRKRRAIEMINFESKTYEQAAAILGVPFTTVNNWVSRFKEDVREAGERE